MARYQPRDADFVLAGDDTWTEELARPSDLDPDWIRFAGRPLAYLLAVALVTGCLVRATADGPGSTSAARNPVVVDAPNNDLAAHGVTVYAPVATAPEGSLISDDLATACPATRSCLSSRSVPPPLLAALRAAFPRATAVSVHTVSLSGATSDRLLGRLVRATTGDSSITVQVLPTRLPREAGVSGRGANTIAYAQRPAGTMTVRTTVIGPVAAAGPGAGPARLAADTRLLAVG